MFSSAANAPTGQQQQDPTATTTPDAQHVPPPPPPPPPPDRNIGATLPEGWTTACDPVDGSMYYCNVSTGETSWTHPNFKQRRASFWQPSSWFSRTTTATTPPPPPKPTNHHPFSAPFLTGGATNTAGTQQTTRRPPDNHECYSVMALLLCFPIGLLACYHSLQVNRKWERGLYGPAYNHSRQAPKYACAATFIGCCFWFFVLVVRPESKVVDWQWPDWKFD